MGLKIVGPFFMRAKRVRAKRVSYFFNKVVSKLLGKPYVLTNQSPLSRDLRFHHRLGGVNN
jgi:hypothetical protein